MPGDLASRGWVPVLDEDFTGSQLDESLWTVVDREQTVPEAVSLEPTHPGDSGNGYLTLTAGTNENGDLRTGGVTTNGVTGQHYRTDGFVGTYGYLEARIKFSNEPGTNSAFWTLAHDYSPFGDPGASGPEIDIAEHQHPSVNGDDMNIRLHWDGYAEDHKSYGPASDPGNPTGTPFYDNFHTYSLLWTPDGYWIYADGHEMWHTSEALTYSPERILLTHNLRPGGFAGEYPEDGYGSLEDSTNQTVIDHVRVWQRPISEVPDQTGQVNEPISAPFWVTDHFSASPDRPEPGSVRVTATSSDDDVVPDGGATVTGNGPPDPDGTLQNGSFESGSTGWAVPDLDPETAGTQNSAQVQTDAAYTGTASLHLDGDSDGRVTQTITGLRPDTRYTLALRHHLQVTPGDELARIDWGIADVDASTAGDQGIHRTAKKVPWVSGRPYPWTPDQIMFHTGAGTTQVTLYVDNTAYVGTPHDGDVAIDHVYLRPVIPPNRTLTVLPASGATGETTITLTALDADDQVLGTEELTVAVDDSGSFTYGSFEDRPLDDPWSHQGSSQVTVEDPFRPDRVLQVGSESTGTTTQQVSGLQPDTTYRLQADGRIEESLDGTPGPGLVFQDDAGNQHVVELTSTDWENREVTFTTGPGVTEGTIHVLDWNHENGAAWFDDIRLTPLDGSAPPAMTAPGLHAIEEQRLVAGRARTVPVDLGAFWSLVTIDELSSSSPYVLPGANLALEGTGRHRVLSMTPLPDRTGATTVTLDYTLAGTSNSAEVAVDVSDARLVNPGFEDGATGWSLSAGATRDTGAPRTGDAALQLGTSATATQTLAGPDVTGHPGPEVPGLDWETTYVVSGWGRDGSALQVRVDGNLLGETAWSSSEWTYKEVVFTTPDLPCASCWRRDELAPVQLDLAGPDTGGPALVDDLSLRYGPTMTRLRDWSLKVGEDRTDWVTANHLSVGRVPSHAFWDPNLVEIESSDETVMPLDNIHLQDPRPMRPLNWQLRLFGADEPGRSDVTVRLHNPVTGGELERTFTVTVSSGNLNNGDFERGMAGWSPVDGPQGEPAVVGTVPRREQPSPQDHSGVLRVARGGARWHVTGLDPSTDYVLEASALGDDASIDVESETGNVLGSTTIPSPDPDDPANIDDQPGVWSDLDVTFSTGPGQTSVNLYIRDHDANQVPDRTSESCVYYRAGESCVDSLFLAPDPGS